MLAACGFLEATFADQFPTMPRVRARFFLLFTGIQRGGRGEPLMFLRPSQSAFRAVTLRVVLIGLSMDVVT